MQRTRWSVLVAFALVTSANQMLWLTFAPVTTDAARHYGVSEGTIGVLSAVFPLLYVVLAIPTGFALDRWFRPSLTLGAGLTALGGLLRLVGDSFAWVLVGQLVVAVAQPFVTSSVAKLAAAYTSERDRALGISVCSSALFAGFLLAFGSGAAFGGGSGLHRLLLAQAAYSTVGAVFLALALRGPGPDVPAPTVAATASLGVIWGDRVLRSLILLVVAGFGVFVGLTTWLQALLEPRGVSTSTAGVLLLVMVVAGVIGSAVVPPLAAARGAERSVLGVSLVLAAAGTASLAVVRPVVAEGAALAVTGFVLLATLPVVLEVVERRAGPVSGTAASLLWMSGNAGGLVVTGVTAPLLHHPAAAFLLLGGVALLGLPVLARLSQGDLRSMPTGPAAAVPTP